MFMLKFPAASSTPSLLASAVPSTPSPPRRACSPTRSPGGTLNLINEQRQQDRGVKVSPLSIPRARTTSLLSFSAQKPTVQPFIRVKSPNTTCQKQRAKTKTFAGDQIADESSDMMLTPGQLDTLSASPSRQSIMMIEEDERAIKSSSSSAHNISVCVRMRPSKKTSNEQVWSLDGENNRIVPTDHHPAKAKRQNGISSPSKKASGSSTFASNGTTFELADDAYDFRFDRLVMPSTSIDEMYHSNIGPVVDAVVDGYNGTVFAYGQTGSGKTHTMSGSTSEKGVIPRAVEDIFVEVEKESSRREFLLRVSYLEIYNETLKDLLAPYPSSFSSTDLTARPASPIKGGSSHVAGGGSDLRIVEAGGRIQIQGLREEIVTSAGEVLNLIEWGQQRRHQAATDWNERSSRSHCVFILTVESRDQSQDRQSDDIRFSQLNLIDLAGSERAATEKERRKEGSFINKSLLTLGTVIARLSEQCQTGHDDGHIPYRDSKLTRLLQTSLGGNARVAVVCTISPDKEHAIESLSTLRFGQRCKSIITKAKKGTVMNDKALIARYKKELERLRSQLDQGQSSVLNSIDDNSIKELQSQREEVEKDVQNMNEKREELKKQVEHLTRLILTGKSVAEESHSSIEMDTEKSRGTPRPRKLIRMSDMGTSSPSKRIKLLPEGKMPLTPLCDGQEDVFMTPTSSAMKPFGLESEVASLKKTLALTAAGRQASEDARLQEMQAWKSRVMELEAAYTEQVEELDEAEEAYKKLQNERDSLRTRVEKEMETNRLLQLVATSRSGDDSSLSQMKELLEQSQLEPANAKSDLGIGREKQQKMKEAQQGQMMTLKHQLMALQSNLNEERGKSEQIVALQKEVYLLRGVNCAVNGNDEVNILRNQLEAALQAQEEAQSELRQVYSERGQEDAERDFADLIKGTTTAEEDESAEERLKRRDVKIQSLYKELVSVKKELEELKRVDSKSLLPQAIRADESSAALAESGGVQRATSLQDNVLSTGMKGDAVGSQSYKEEIERLHTVIASQKNIMTDLEASVDAWRGRLRLQNDIITRLVEATGGKISIPEDLNSPSFKSAHLKRTSSAITSDNGLSHVAHAFNKAPPSSSTATGLGLETTSPTKGVAWLATMPGVKPESLSSPGLLSSPGNRHVRRKTIEHEIEELKGSPRVRATADRLLTTEASSASLRTLPSTPGSPAKVRSSRDYYI